jgi:hypothetical protein
MSAHFDAISLCPSDSAFDNLTHSFCGMCCEAAAYCLESNGHTSPTTLVVEDTVPASSQLRWNSLPISAPATYGDHDVAAENGAYAVAIALVHHKHRHQAVERASKGGGFDFWVANLDAELPFERSARLEVSGIFQDASRVKSRLAQKLRQVKRRNDDTRHFAVVAEFSTPLVAIVQGGNP